MNEARICPQCGLPQQWEMWRLCPCGYDFGPPLHIPVGKRGESVAAGRYRTFWPRFCAGFVDGLVFLPINFIDGYFSAPARGPSILIVWAVISYSAYWLYSVLLHARYGQTLGKMATNIRVLDLSEERIPSLRQAFIRDFGYILLNTLSLFWLLYLIVTGAYGGGIDVPSGPGNLLGFASLGWFLLEVITMLSNPKRRAFHDFLAGTVVVRGA